MGLLSELFANIENTRGQIKRRGLLSLPAIMGENIAQRVGPGLTATEHARSVVPEVRDAGRQKSTESVLGLLGAIKAYHGSPHKFDKFDMSKIGTGEGAQAYGHGLYFAENPSVASGYSKNLAMVRDKRASVNDVITQMSKNSPESHTAKNVQWYMKQDPGLGDYVNDDSIVQEILRAVRGRSPDGTVSRASLDSYKRLEELIPETKPQMYETSLRWPDAAREAKDPLGPQHFLDWDKPLSQQPPAVRNALGAGDKDAGLANVNRDMTGQQLHNELALAMGRDKVRDFVRGQGIPGIRYLDAGSRGAGEGTANYVLFDDALVEILKRNGLAP